MHTVRLTDIILIFFLLMLEIHLIKSLLPKDNAIQFSLPENNAVQNETEEM